MDLRERVFVGEQGVDPAEEVDSLDDQSVQLVGLDETGVIATCRIRDVGGGDWKLERMAVEPRLRRLGVGARLLEGAEQEASTRGAGRMVMHAQRKAEGFYAAHGYTAEGETFLEAEIEHVRMHRALDG